MKITYSAAQKATYFSDLNVGEVFTVSLDGSPFLKTMECDTSNHNAVNLVANCIARIDPGTKVIPVECELIIK